MPITNVIDLIDNHVGITNSNLLAKRVDYLIRRIGIILR